MISLKIFVLILAAATSVQAKSKSKFKFEDLKSPSKLKEFQKSPSRLNKFQKSKFEESPSKLKKFQKLTKFQMKKEMMKKPKPMMKKTMMKKKPDMEVEADCDHTQCEQWDCSQWCACYEEKKIPIYAQHSCMDDGEECNCAPPSSVPAPIISSNQPAKWGQPVAKSEPAKWGSCPNGNKDLAIYECPKDAGKKCWSGKKRGYFNNGNAETNPKGQCQECPAIDGCQLNRPLHSSKGGGPNFCTCHTCFGQYTDCPKGESCGHTNQITGKNNQRYVSRFLTKDRSQCTLCSTDADDKCAMWGTKYGKKGKEACICHTCLKGWKKNLKGKCTHYMSNSFATTGKLTEWKALPKYKEIKKIWKITAADLSRIG